MSTETIKVQRAFKMKSHLIPIVLLIIFWVILPSQGLAEMYKWVDEKGTIHFQDYRPSNLKPSTKVEILTKEQLEFNNYVKSPKEGTDKSPYSSLAIDGKKKDTRKSKYDKNQEIELYTTSWCGYCKKARAFLNARGIEFKEYDIEKDKNAAKRHRKLNRRGGIPVAVINGKKIIGFSRASYENVLKKR